MSNKIQILFAALLFVCLQLNAKEPQQQLSYNMQRGIESFYREQYKDALEYMGVKTKCTNGRGDGSERKWLLFR